MKISIGGKLISLFGYKLMFVKQENFYLFDITEEV